METIGSKPVGLKGRLAGVIMNLIHASQYKKIIQKYLVENIDTSGELSVLDIGCGGGKVVNIFSSLIKKVKIFGIDHSLDMVNLSQKVNKNGINDGMIEIVQGDVKKLPYPNDSFNIVTAFDTISFWNDFNDSINEIKRVLKQDGIFFIVNGYPKVGTKWYDFVKFKNDNEYRAFLTRHGFKEINLVIEKNTIIIKALK
jgi:ubiquinone/menaquinone biosynthesis C-methylase UbiE